MRGELQHGLKVVCVCVEVCAGQQPFYRRAFRAARKEAPRARALLFHAKIPTRIANGAERALCMQIY